MKNNFQITLIALDLIDVANKQLLKHLNSLMVEYDWIVDIDLQSFFDEVNQDKLMTIIHRIIKDDDIISLIRKFLQSGVMKNGVFHATNKGTP